MAQIKILPQLSLIDEYGVVATCTAKRKKPEPVHLRQGSLDGACGPYCLCMALIALGIEKHSQLTSLSDSKTARKLFKEIADCSPALIREGTGLRRMMDYAKKYSERGLIFEQMSAKLHGNEKAAKEDNKHFDHSRINQFVLDHFWEDHLVILASKYHWVMVVGLQYDEEIDAEISPQFYLVLDPSEEAPTYSVWNGVIDISQNGKGNKWFGSGNHSFYDALAVWK